MSLAVIGATSEIATSVARRFFEDQHDLFLVARAINNIASFEKVSGKCSPTVVKCECDVTNVNLLESTAEKIIESFGEDPYVLVAIGSIEGQSDAKKNANAAARIIDINFRNLIMLLTPIVGALERRRKGCLIIISSVSGDRGRKANYIYGAAKGGLSVFCQGLTHRLADSGVHVLTVKPGYVNTRMYRQSIGSEYRRVPEFFVGDVDKVSERIYAAARKRKHLIYVDPIWRAIMLVIRSLPEVLFKRLNL